MKYICETTRELCGFGFTLFKLSYSRAYKLIRIQCNFRPTEKQENNWCFNSRVNKDNSKHEIYLSKQIMKIYIVAQMKIEQLKYQTFCKRSELAIGLLTLLPKLQSTSNNFLKSDRIVRIPYIFHLVVLFTY